MMPICNTIAEAFVLIFFLRTTTDCVVAVKVCNLFFYMCTVQILSCLYDLINFFLMYVVWKLIVIWTAWQLFCPKPCFCVFCFFFSLKFESILLWWSCNDWILLSKPMSTEWMIANCYLWGSETHVSWLEGLLSSAHSIWYLEEGVIRCYKIYVLFSLKRYAAI